MEIHRELLKVFRKMVLDSKCTRKKKVQFLQRKKGEGERAIKMFYQLQSTLKQDKQKFDDILGKSLALMFVKNNKK